MDKEELGRVVVSSLSLPADLAAKTPRIVITGNSSVLVENHGGILAFGSEELRVACVYGEVVVKGRGLRLSVLKKEEMEAEGEIISVSYRRQEEKV